MLFGRQLILSENRNWAKSALKETHILVMWINCYPVIAPMIWTLWPVELVSMVPVPFGWQNSRTFQDIFNEILVYFHGCFKTYYILGYLSNSSDVIHWSYKLGFAVCLNIIQARFAYMRYHKMWAMSFSFTRSSSILR